LRALPGVSEGRWATDGIADFDRWVRAGRRRRIERNLKRFDPRLGENERVALARRIYRDRWATPVGVYGARGSSVVPTVAGREHLESALAERRGVLFWESPFGFRELLHAALAHLGLPFTQVHGAEHGGGPSWVGQRILKPLSRRAEQRLVPEIIDIQEGAYAYLRRIRERLAANRIVCMPGLGPKGRKFLLLDFLGGRERFATGVANLALTTGATLLPVFGFRDEAGKWRTVFEPPVRFDGSRSKQEALATAVEGYARTLETYIRRYPEQWRRWHAKPIAAENRELPAVTVDRTAGQDPA